MWHLLHLYKHAVYVCVCVCDGSRHEICFLLWVPFFHTIHKTVTHLSANIITPTSLASLCRPIPGRPAAPAPPFQTLSRIT